MLKPALYSLILLVFLFGCSSQKAAVTESESKLPGTYLEAVTIDGKPDEWSNVPHDLSQGSTVEYSVANNNNNVFILMRVPNLLEQAKILQGGMDVWVSTNNKKDKHTGITYPVKGELGDLPQKPLAPGEKPDVKQQHLQLAAQIISMQRFGFKPEYNTVQSIRQNTGFSAAINWDANNVMIYELTIPFSAFETAVTADHLEIGISIHGIDRPKNNSQSENTSYNDGLGSMGGGRRGGGNFGNRMQGSRRAENNNYNQREKLYVQETFWTEYAVTKK
jgi:hypothetical protein